jgi:energy-coupling factor transporter transmembrane protein EcfT
VKELIQRILFLFSCFVTFVVFLVILSIGVKFLVFVILPLILLWLVVGLISWFVSRLFGRNGNKREGIYRGKGSGEVLDIPPEDFTSTPLK